MHGQDQGEKQGGQGLKVAAAYQERGSYGHREAVIWHWVLLWTEGEATLAYCHTCFGHSTQTTICALPGYK